MASHDKLFENKLNQFQHKVIDPVLIAGSIFGLIALGSSLSRFIQFGWFNVFYIHIGTYLGILLITLYRRKISAQLKALTLVSLMFLVGIAGLISRGIVGSSFIWFIAGSITSIFILGNRFALVYIGLGIVSMLFVAYFTINGNIGYTENLAAYVTSKNTWGLEIFTAALISALLFSSEKKINSFFYKALSESQQNEKNIRLLIDRISDSVLVFNHNFKIIDANIAFANLVNEDLTIIRTKNVTDYTHLINFNINELDLNNLPQHKTIDITKKNKNEVLHLDLSHSAFTFRDESVIMAVMKDITQQKQREREHLELVMQTEESEREKFAKELHDGVGPILSTSKMYLDILADNNLNEEGVFVLNKVKESIDDALQGLKEISNKISPHILKNFGVVNAISNFIEKHNKSFNVKFHLNANLEERLERVN